MNKVSLQIPTPLDALELFASLQCGSACLSLKGFEFCPSLPPGMQVAQCHAALIQLSEVTERATVEIGAHLHSSGAVSGGAETGERLETIAWGSSQHILLVGTEDAEYLRARLPRSVRLDDPFVYQDKQLSFTISCQARGPSFSLHLIAAWNELPEPVDCSCWYAVDQPHKVLEAISNVPGANEIL